MNNATEKIRKAARDLLVPSVGKQLRAQREMWEDELKRSELELAKAKLALDQASWQWFYSAVTDDLGFSHRSEGFVNWEWAWESQWG